MSQQISDFLVKVFKVRDQWREEDQKKHAERKDEDSFEPSACWFRGVSRANYPLRPQLYRKTDYQMRKLPRKEPDEDEIRYAFKSRAAQMMSEPHLPATEKEWYFLMQHYGAPTRLLDWTEGALLGLYFSVRTQKTPRDAAVWMLDPEWLNDIVTKSEFGVMLPEWHETDPWFPTPFDETLHPQLPLAIDPPHVARRLTVQRSHFTIHGTDKDGLDNLVSKANSRLIKSTIEASDVVQILDDLGTCGIAESTVFPDLEGLSRELEHQWGGE